jgi:hypothetical protein
MYYAMLIFVMLQYSVCHKLYLSYFILRNENFPAFILSYHVLGIFRLYSKNIHNITICECFVKWQAAKMTGLWLAKPRHGALG